MLTAVSHFFRWLLLPRNEPREPRFAAQRYSRQRRLGFPFLQFFPEIEREYLDSFFVINRVRIRVAHTLGLGSIVGFILVDRFFGLALQPLMSTAVLVLICGAGFALPLAATYVPRLAHYQQRFINTGTLCVGLGMIEVIYLGRLSQVWFPYEAILLVTIYVYFLSGLLWRQAAGVGWLLWSVFMLMDLTGYGKPVPWLVYEVYYLFITNAIGMIGRYIFEYQDRLSFLLQHELRHLAQHDSLTGLLNRRAFRQNAERVWAQAARERRSVGLLLLDMDHFKKINDRYGHLTGDAVLLAAGGVLRKFARRPLDCAGRFGGDEFVALWYDVEPHGFESILHDLRGKLGELVIEHELGSVQVQVSGGAVMVWPKPGDQLHDSLQVADTNLYENKRLSGTIRWTELPRAA